jgi:hypothetical protein
MAVARWVLDVSVGARMGLNLRTSPGGRYRRARHAQMDGRSFILAKLRDLNVRLMLKCGVIQSYRSLIRLGKPKIEIG